MSPVSGQMNNDSGKRRTENGKRKTENEYWFVVSLKFKSKGLRVKIQLMLFVNSVLRSPLSAFRFPLFAFI